MPPVGVRAKRNCVPMTKRMINEGNQWNRGGWRTRGRTERNGTRKRMKVRESRGRCVAKFANVRPCYGLQIRYLCNSLNLLSPPMLTCLVWSLKTRLLHPEVWMNPKEWSPPTYNNNRYVCEYYSLTRIWFNRRPYHSNDWLILASLGSFKHWITRLAVTMVPTF